LRTDEKWAAGQRAPRTIKAVTTKPGFSHLVVTYNSRREICLLLADICVDERPVAHTVSRRETVGRAQVDEFRLFV
jgi:hypothetical protein